MAAYYEDRRQSFGQRLIAGLQELVEALEQSPQPPWLELHLNQPPTNPNLICIGEVDGTVYYCHPDDEDRLRIELNLPKPE